MIALDTNILARLGMVADDARQSRAAAAFIDGDEAFFVPITVVLELEWLLRGIYKVEREKIIEGFHGLLAIRNLHFEQEAVVLAALSFYETGFDFSDALHYAGSEGCESFATFDKDLVKRAARASLMPPVILLKS